MTRKEAIEIIEFEKCHCKSHLNDADMADEFYKEMNEFVEAFDMAIKALEAEPCEDCISRADAFKALRIKGDYNTLNEVYERLEKLPPVTPARKKGKWITIHEDEEDEPAAGFFRCSCCKDELYDITKYCPSCGSYNGG